MIYPNDFMNKIIHGDCLEVMKSVPDNSVDLIVTDPPYGINYSSNGGPRVSKERKNKIAQETRLLGDMNINPEWFIQMYRVLRTESALYCFCGWETFSEMKDHIKKAGFIIKTPLVWDKGNCGMGDLKGDYGNQTEIIIFATKGRHILHLGRHRNIFKVQRPADAYRLHPTQKPEELLHHLILKSSEVGQIVLDPFVGSGSTLMASKSLDRKFIGIEKDEKYYKIAEHRLES